MQRTGRVQRRDEGGLHATVTDGLAAQSPAGGARALLCRVGANYGERTSGCGRPPTNRPLLAVREDGGVYSPSLRSRAVRLPPTPCRVCFRPCVFNKFSDFWQKTINGIK